MSTPMLVDRAEDVVDAFVALQEGNRGNDQFLCTGPRDSETVEKQRREVPAVDTEPAGDIR